MPPSAFRICPACETRNKAAWEFCARCGESLQGISLAAKGAPTPAAAEPTGQGPKAASLVLTLGLFGAVAGAVLFLVRSHAVLEADHPNPSLFSFPTVPPALSATSSAAPRSVKGADSFAEGRRFFSAGDAARALPLLAEAVSEDGQNAEYRAVYGKALLASGGAPDEGLRQLQEAVRLAPANLDYLSSLGQGLDNAKRGREAVAVYEAVLALQADYGDTLEDLGRLYFREGQEDKAIPLLRRASDLRPNDLPLRQDLAMALEKSGDVAGAEALYRHLLNMRPQADVTRGLLAETQIKQGHQDQAIATFQEGLQRNPNAPLLHRGLASALERSGRMDDAIKAYREYARLAPGSTDAKAMAERADALEKKIKDASS